MSVSFQSLLNVAAASGLKIRRSAKVFPAAEKTLLEQKQKLKQFSDFLSVFIYTTSQSLRVNERGRDVKRENSIN